MLSSEGGPGSASGVEGRGWREWVWLRVGPELAGGARSMFMWARCARFPGWRRRFRGRSLSYVLTGLRRGVPSGNCGREVGERHTGGDRARRRRI